MCPEQCLAPNGHASCSGARPFSLGGGKGRCSSLQGWIDTQPSSMGRSPVSYSSPVPKPRLWAPLQQGKGLSHRNGQGRLLQKHCSDTAGLGSCPAISCCPSLCSLTPQPSSLCSQDGCHRSRPHIHTPPHAGKSPVVDAGPSCPNGTAAPQWRGCGGQRQGDRLHQGRPSFLSPGAPLQVACLVPSCK